MTELKPCPFCGGEVYLKQHNRYTVHNWHIKHVDASAECLINQHTPHYLTSKHAVEAWNARWERTCHMNYVSLYDEECADGIECDECGWSELYDPGYPHPAHCPGCGAKVVGE